MASTDGNCNNKSISVHFISASSCELHVWEHMQKLFEALIFVFVMHPFDVGDRCVVDGVPVISSFKYYAFLGNFHMYSFW